jgi:hypothetical protein
MIFTFRKEVCRGKNVQKVAVQEDAVHIACYFKFVIRVLRKLDLIIPDEGPQRSHQNTLHVNEKK